MKIEYILGTYTGKHRDKGETVEDKREISHIAVHSCNHKCNNCNNAVWLS